MRFKFSALWQYFKKSIAPDIQDDHEEDLDFEESSISSALNLLRYRDVPIKDIMTQRADIKWIDLDKPFSKSMAEILKSPHRYYPASRHDLDKIEGKFDLLAHFGGLEKQAHFDFAKHLTPVLYVAPTLGCHDLLVQMKDAKNNMAMVVDEFGGVDGLVTLSDINLKIIAEMDMDRTRDLKSKVLKDKSVVVDGRMGMEEFESQFGKIQTAEDKESDPETIGGLVLSVAGYIPARGEIISHSSGVEFEILQSDARKIKRLRILHVDKLA